MASSAQQIRSYDGPVLFTYGFRPFFLFGALWAALAVALWLPMLAGSFSLPTHLSPLDWHVHELIYGYLPAVVAGFLLTAVPNWTGRLPVVGKPLAALFGLWVAGRIAISLSAWLGTAAAVAVDLSFLLALAAVIGREIVAGGNWRNLKVLLAVCLLFAGNVVFHLEAVGLFSGGYGMRIGVGVAVLLIMLIGGRIVPSFTRNWLARRGGVRLPTAFNRFDGLVLGASAVGLALWVALPDSPLTGGLAAVLGVLHGVRLARWAGLHTSAEPLVLILHVAYAFVPLGFLLLATSILQPAWVAPSGAVHGWTAGAIGLMTLAVMTRASLGHTGRPLAASAGIRAIYGLAVTSALARIAAAFGLWPGMALELAAAAWVLAFGSFVWIYAPLLARRAA